MKTLSKQQQDILLDYYFECASQGKRIPQSSFLLSNRGAREFYDKLHHSRQLSNSSILTHSTCPDHLVEQRGQTLQPSIC
jgi:hypothetical protein